MHVRASQDLTFSFTDFGADLGRSTIAARMPFKPASGVEIDPDLADKGNANIARAGGPKCAAQIVVAAQPESREDGPILQVLRGKRCPDRLTRDTHMQPGLLSFLHCANVLHACPDPMSPSSFVRVADRNFRSYKTITNDVVSLPVTL